MRQAATRPPPAGPGQPRAPIFPGTADEPRAVRTVLCPVRHGPPAAAGITRLASDCAPAPSCTAAAAGAVAPSPSARTAAGRCVHAGVQDQESTRDGNVHRSAGHPRGLCPGLDLPPRQRGHPDHPGRTPDGRTPAAA